MAKLETLYIVQPQLADEQVDELIRGFDAVIPENKGTLIKTDKWGKRRLAYRIGRHWEGYYVVSEYEGEGSTQKELERRLRIHEHVLRHLTTSVDPRMAAELVRRAEREKRGDDRRDDEGWGGDRYGDRDDDGGRGRRGGRGDRGDRDRGEGRS